jgi:hypothetical protein
MRQCSLTQLRDKSRKYKLKRNAIVVAINESDLGLTKIETLAHPTSDIAKWLGRINILPFFFE